MIERRFTSFEADKKTGILDVILRYKFLISIQEEEVYASNLSTYLVHLGIIVKIFFQRHVCFHVHEHPDETTVYT